MDLVCRECGTKQPKALESSFGACRVCLSKVPPSPSGIVEVRWVSTKKGRGVFTRTHLKRGDLIEVCHAVILSPEECSRIPHEFPVINRYVFPWDPGKCFLTGYGLVYNHESKESTGRSPNMKSMIHLGSLTVTFLADREIRAGEELTYDYRGILFSRSA